jgi:xeroderma pigmentosum group C-complementing protein
VIEKDLLKFEALYPADIKPIGKIRNHDIYPRTAVAITKADMGWIREARSVKEGETPYKVVKAMPKLSIPKAERVQLYMDTFGFWQTVPYIRPKVIDGKIERNEFGNVYMYHPQMVPEGCVHLKQKGVLAMARSLNLEAVPAVVGWEFTGGRNHPTVDGCVVLEKDAETLSKACTEWLEIRTYKKAKKAEDRALQLWRRFVKGKFLLQKMKKRFNVE